MFVDDEVLLVVAELRHSVGAEDEERLTQQGGGRAVRGGLVQEGGEVRGEELKERMRRGRRKQEGGAAEAEVRGGNGGKDRGFHLLHTPKHPVGINIKR